MVLFWPKSALEMAARGEVGDVEDAGSDTLPGNRPRLGPGASSQLVRPGIFTAARAPSRRAVGTPGPAPRTGTQEGAQRTGEAEKRLRW